MTKQTSNPPADQGIRRIAITGFKSLLHRQEIEVRHLTILAGANSSGKSSIMQPLLLLKQTLEAPYDPGALKLDGPNVRYTAAEQFLARKQQGGMVNGFKVELSIIPPDSAGDRLDLTFEKRAKAPIDVVETTTTAPSGDVTVRTDMTSGKIRSLLMKYEQGDALKSLIAKGHQTYRIARNRSFLSIQYEGNRAAGSYSDYFDYTPEKQVILDIIHLRGLRGNPERQYPVAAFGEQFPGEFERYVAGILSAWKIKHNKAALEAVGEDLLELGLTWKVEARAVSETQVELYVGRMPRPKSGGARDLVSIADVGFGVSQTLPVVVALHVARPGQLVYIEQPEIHLHPRAQVAMAGVLARAAQRGIRVVCETHSAHILLALQSLVAEEALSPELVALHWFTRKEGITTIQPGRLDKTGAYGDWPEDFSDVILQQEGRYLDAAGERAEEAATK